MTRSQDISSNTSSPGLDPRARRTTRAQRLVFATALGLGSTLMGQGVGAQVVELDLRSSVFLEPSEGSNMTVLNPRLGLSVMPVDTLRISAAYEADIVSGATEPTKAGPLSPDIVSHASIHDTRHIATGSLALERKHASLSVGYSYGAEKDYRSNALTVVGSTDFFQRNTTLQLSYTRAFDEVCNLAYSPAVDPTLRQRLDTSDGCFTAAADRQTQDVDVDSYQLGWTQNWTPVLVTQMIASGSLMNGFLGNPYREVVIGPTGEAAQENHPENRARGAIALRVRYFIKPLDTAVSVGARGYRDTWDILGQTYELGAERAMTTWLRVLARGRYYKQTGALFWSDDYTGGEPRFGPRGQYWSGDRELSPLSSYSLGGRAVAHWRGRSGDRLAGMFLEFEVSAALDVLSTQLDDFTWNGVSPDDTTAWMGSLGAHMIF